MKKENKDKIKLILTLSVVCPIGFCLGYLGAMGVDNFISNLNVPVEKQKYGDMYELMLKDRLGRVVTLENFKEPITVQLAENFSDNEKKQIVEAINTLDAISPNINYTLLEDSDYKVTANISVIKSNENLKVTSLAATSLDYTLKGQIKFPISITIRESFSNYYANIDEKFNDNLLCRVMKHEMMHTLGFADLYDRKHFDNSIMWYSTENANVVKDYTSRDKACINRIYDKMLVSVTYPSKMYVGLQDMPLYKHQDDELELK